MIELKSDQELIKEANKIIDEAKKCVTTGEGMERKTCHIFLDHSNICQCGARDLSKYAERVK